MEESLLYEKLNCQTLVFSEKQTREETAETVVPDTMPDIAELLETDAQVYLRSKEIADGKVKAEGQITGTVLYLGEDSLEVQKIEISIPCGFSFDAEEAREDDKVIVTLRVISADARALNPRKLLLRSDVRIDIFVYRAESIAYTVGAEEREGLQTLLSDETISYDSEITEKTFVISEELAFPAGSPAVSKILFARTAVSVDETKNIGGKMILQGTATAIVLYVCEEESAVRCEKLSAPFSQITDAEEGAAASVYPALTAAYTEPLPESYGVTGIHLELHVTAQVLCRRCAEIRCLADAYSLNNPCAVQTKSLVLPGEERETVLRETLQERIELTHEANEILSAYAYFGAPGECEGGAALPVSIHILYKTEAGSLAGASIRRSIAFNVEAAEKRKISFGEVRGGDVTVSPSGNSLDVRLTVEIPALVWEKKEIAMVSALESEEDKPIEGCSSASLIVVRYKEGTLWDLAKKYCSTTELIENANPEPIRLDDLLLIPRAR